MRILELFRRRPKRCIFRFTDGRRTRYADPMVAWRAIEDVAGSGWSDLLRLLTTDPPPGTVGEWAERRRKDQEAAAARLAEAACVAFGVEPLRADGKGGLTRAERVGLVAHFLAYMGGLAEQATFPGGPGGGWGGAPGPDVSGAGGTVGTAAPDYAPAGA